MGTRSSLLKITSRNEPGVDITLAIERYGHYLNSRTFQSEMPMNLQLFYLFLGWSCLLNSTVILMFYTQSSFFQIQQNRRQRQGCVTTGNIRGNVSSNNLLATAPAHYTLVHCRPILCQIVRFKSGFMTRRRAQNGAIPTFTDINGWTPGNATTFIPPHDLLTVNFTLRVSLH